MKGNLPVVVIVGRPNVGKSTLFNRLIGKRVAVVEDEPGVTRDRLYAEAEWTGHKYLLVDTGGILFGEEDPLVEQIRTQAQVALSEADIILFMTDTAEGLNPTDRDLANLLRGVKKPIFLVANKVDSDKRAELASEFFELGIGELYSISGLHGRGVADLLDELVKTMPAAEAAQEAQEETSLAIVGRPNVGKSSLLNAFLGEKRAIVSDIPGTTRDAIDTLIQFEGNPIRLIDTAGIRRRGKIQGTVEYYMVLRATRAMERSQCALVLVDGVEGLTDGDKRIMKVAHDLGKALVIVVNKWDQHEPPDGAPRKMSPEKKDMVRRIRDEMPEVSYAQIVFTSAKESAGLNGVIHQALAAIENWNFRIGTGRLNRLIQDACFEKPLTRKGKSLKIYYSTQVSACPPTFVLFCNDPEMLHFSYQRYLENRLRKEFPMTGTPIRVFTRSSHKDQEDDGR